MVMTRRDVLRLAAVAFQPRVPQTRPAAGRLLVAARELQDPNFARSVVLLGQYDGEKGSMGLILNHPAPLKISEVLDWPLARQRTEKTYFGGPVQRTGVLALARSASKPGDARLVFGDVYLVSTRPILEKLLPESGAGKLRLYLGYSGWGTGQLEMELRIGSWHVVPGDADVVFDPAPATLWDRMIKRTELRIA